MKGHSWLSTVLGGVHAVALTLWIALLVAAGVAAAGAFATLPDLGISLRGYESFATGDSSDHGRLAAGKMLERIFTAIDFAQIPLAAIALAAFALQLILSGDRWRRPANVIRAACMVAAAALLTFHMAFIAPRMNSRLQAYWSAARAGDTDTALAHRDAFNQYHPRAELIMQSNLLLLLIAAGAAGASPVQRSSPSSDGPLQTPLLARRRT